MSLDVHLNFKSAKEPQLLVGIFIKEDGEIKELSEQEWNERFPNREPLKTQIQEIESDEDVYWANITHNLNKMAKEAGIYEHLWRPDEINITKAKELIEPLTEGLKKLKEDPEHYEQFNSENGWGLYKNFVPFVEKYLNACIEFPDATVRVSR